MKLFEMKQARETALAKAESNISAAETAGRPMTAVETEAVNTAMAEVNALNPQITAIESVNTLRAQFPKGQVIAPNPTQRRATTGRRVLSAEYMDAFQAFCASRGTVVSPALAEGADGNGGYAFPALPKQSAALYEGSNAAGGYSVPVEISGDFVPLAPPEMGVYSLVQVIPTSHDIKFPTKTAHGTAAAKAESGGSTNNFGGGDPTVGQLTLSAYMMGHIEDASWELLQDVPAFGSFMSDDVLLSLAVLRENWIVNGNGTGQAQGLIGNVGTGITGVLVGSDNYASELLAATFDVQGTLNAFYFDENTRWLMNRATSIALRKAQFTANTFEPVFTRVGGVDYLHGIPVAYSSQMPNIATTTSPTPVLFGNFKRGYIFGERGGSGVNVKILDQTKAASGLTEILGYQRVDGRVRRSEAIQGITLHA